MNNICLFVCFLKGPLGFLPPSVFLGVAFFLMVPSLCPSSIHDAPCPHCSGFYTLGDLPRYVKSVHLHTSLVSQACQFTLSLQVFSLPMLHLGFIPLAFWGCFQMQSSFILGLFKVHFACFRLFHRILQTIQNKVRQGFYLPFDQIAWDLMDELAWFIFLLLSHWCLHYNRGGCSS